MRYVLTLVIVLPYGLHDEFVLSMMVLSWAGLPVLALNDYHKQLSQSSELPKAILVSSISNESISMG